MAQEEVNNMYYTAGPDYQSASASYSTGSSSENNEKVKYETTSNRPSSTAMCSRGCNPCNGCRH